MPDIAVLADRSGLDSIWTWGHLRAMVGDPVQPIFEGWTTLAAWAALTRQVQLGLMVGASIGWTRPWRPCRRSSTAAA